MIYVTNATHMLDDKGAIGPTEGPALEMATFIGTIITKATWSGEPRIRAACRESGSVVIAVVSNDGDITWSCTNDPDCTEQGIITHWQGTLWDVSASEKTRPPA